MITRGAAAREVGGGGGGGRVFPAFDFSDVSDSISENGSDSSDWVSDVRDSNVWMHHVCTRLSFVPCLPHETHAIHTIPPREGGSRGVGCVGKAKVVLRRRGWSWNNLVLIFVEKQVRSSVLLPAKPSDGGNPG